MKIMLDAHVMGKKQAGVERYWKNLILNIVEQGKSDKFVIYSSVNMQSKFNNAVTRVPHLDSGLFRIFWGLNSVIRKEKPDVLYVNFFTPLFKQCRTVSIIHDLCFLTHPELFNPFFVFFARFWLKKTIRDSDFIICPSFVVKKQIMNKYGFRADRISVIYEAADPIFTKIRNKKEVGRYIKNKFGIVGQYFLVAGDLDERNMSKFVISSFLELLKESKDIMLIFTGKCKLSKKILRKSEDNIKVLNYVSDKAMVSLYNGSTAVLNFSKCEGFGLPIVESGACGVPVICNSLNVFKEVAGSDCIYADGSQELTQKMKLLLEGKIRKSGNKRILSYSWKKNARQTYIILDKVAKNCLTIKKKSERIGVGIL